MISKIKKLVKVFRGIIDRINGEFMNSVARGMIYENIRYANGGGNFINRTL